METIEINNATSEHVPTDLVSGFASAAVGLVRKNKKVQLPEKISISIAFVDEETIKKINSKYRKKNQTTDVLSFCYGVDEQGGILGEILICQLVIKKYAAADGKKWEDELKKNIIHGILHVLGFEHGVQMFELQKKFCDEIR